MWAPLHFLLTCQARFDQFAEHMDNGDVRLLDEGGIAAGDGQVVVHQPGQLATAFAGQANSSYTECSCCLYRSQDIWRAPTSGNGDQHVPWPSEGLYLVGKDLFKAVIVAETGKRR